MSALIDGGPAFPTEALLTELGRERNDINVNPREGMSLRDYFAAMALTAIVGSVNLHQASDELYARTAYEIADAMLAARTRSE